MKYLFFSIAIVLSSHFKLAAQSKNHVNLGAGYIHSATIVAIENPLLIGVIPPEPKAGFYVSLAYEHQLSDRWTSQVEMHFQQKGFQTQNLERKTVTIPYNYLGISPTVGFSPINPLTLFIGPELNILLNRSEGKPAEFGLTGRARYQFNRIGITGGYFRALTMYQLTSSGTYSFTNQNWQIGLSYQLIRL
ncbi:hypothetical protein [Spirosoma koreense]